jgi:glycosyltransferase involved in cell wall biosynthesis
VFHTGGRPPPPEEQPYLDHLRRHITHLGVKKRVVITDYLSDVEVAEAMQATDIALVPHTQATNSYSVSFPMSHGRPTLASDLACFREMAARGDCVELFANGDREDLRRKLLTLLADEQRRHELAANAERYAQRFMWPNVAATTRDVYGVAMERAAI